MAIKRKVNLQIIVLSTHINLHSVFYANLLQLVSVTGMLWSGLFFFIRMASRIFFTVYLQYRKII